MSSTSNTEMDLDIEELRQLLALAKRPKVKGLLDHPNSVLHWLLSLPNPTTTTATTTPQSTTTATATTATATATATAATATTTTTKPSSSSSSSSSSTPTSTATKQQTSSTPAPPKASPVSLQDISYTVISEYSWDQDAHNATIYISLPDVGSLSKDKIKVDFYKQHFDLRVHDLKGKNYRLQLGPLNEYDPAGSSFKVRPNRITIQIKKDPVQYWLSLFPQKEPKKPNIEKNADPEKSLMSVMKNLYDEGDDNMKKQIAKAWSESMEKRAKDPNFS